MRTLARIALAALGAIVSLGMTIYLSPANIPGSDAGDCSRNLRVAVRPPRGKLAPDSTALRAPLVSASGSARQQAGQRHTAELAQFYDDRLQVCRALIF